MEQETLLELVETGVKASDFYNKTDENIERATQLEKLGFHNLAAEIFNKVSLKDKLDRISKMGYIKIPYRNIEDYLDRKVKRYNREHSVNNINSTRSGFFSGGHIFINSTLQPQNFNSQDFFMRALNDPLTNFLGMRQSIKNDYEIEKIERITCDYHNPSNKTIGKFVYIEIPISKYKDLPPAEILDELKVHQSRQAFDYFTIAKVSSVHDPILFGRVDNVSDRFYCCQWGNDISLDDII